jgi:cytochrome c oxidase assembly factor CtaG
MGLFAIVLAIVLYFASLNHRSAERGAWWVGQQIFCIAGSLALGGAVLTLVNTFHGRGLR